MASLEALVLFKVLSGPPRTTSPGLGWNCAGWAWLWKYGTN